MNRKNLVSHLENCNPDQLEFLPPEKTSRVRRRNMHKNISGAVTEFLIQKGSGSGSSITKLKAIDPDLYPIL
jgi:hypothetical protein